MLLGKHSVWRLTLNGYLIPHREVIRWSKTLSFIRTIFLTQSGTWIIQISFILALSQLDNLKAILVVAVLVALVAVVSKSSFVFELEADSAASAWVDLVVGLCDRY